jgi:hypothetical protein
LFSAGCFRRRALMQERRVTPPTQKGRTFAAIILIPPLEAGLFIHTAWRNWPAAASVYKPLSTTPMTNNVVRIYLLL